MEIHNYGPDTVQVCVEDGHVVVDVTVAATNSRTLTATVPVGSFKLASDLASECSIDLAGSGAFSIDEPSIFSLWDEESEEYVSSGTKIVARSNGSFSKTYPMFLGDVSEGAYGKLFVAVCIDIPANVRGHVVLNADLIPYDP